MDTGEGFACISLQKADGSHWYNKNLGDSEMHSDVPVLGACLMYLAIIFFWFFLVLLKVQLASSGDN